MSHNLEKFLEVALKLVKNANDIVKERINMSKTVLTKASDIDFVTETDQQVEKILIKGLSHEFPDHRFIGEESSSEGNSPVVLTDDPTWIIDPIDGTMNFVHSNPAVCVSVGLFINKEPSIGIVSIPVFDQLFTAIKGKGAQMNGSPIKVSGQTMLEKALVIMEGGTSRDPAHINMVKENFGIFYSFVRGFRAYGSACYDICSIAIGAVDAYLEVGPHIWDMAAASLVLTEAGGVIIDPSGGPVDYLGRKVVCASSMELATAIAKRMVHYTPKRDDE